MSSWPAAKAQRVFTALLRIGWTVKRQSGSHRLRDALVIPTQIKWWNKVVMHVDEPRASLVHHQMSCYSAVQ